MRPITTATGMNPCPYCGITGHLGRCTSIKAIEYHPDGTIKRVEFYAPRDYVPVIFANPAPQNHYYDP